MDLVTIHPTHFIPYTVQCSAVHCSAVKGEWGWSYQLDVLLTSGKYKGMSAYKWDSCIPRKLKGSFMSYLTAAWQANWGTGWSWGRREESPIDSSLTLTLTVCDCSTEIYDCYAVVVVRQRLSSLSSPLPLPPPIGLFGKQKIIIIIIIKLPPPKGKKKPWPKSEALRRN